MGIGLTIDEQVDRVTDHRGGRKTGTSIYGELDSTVEHTVLWLAVVVVVVGFVAIVWAAAVVDAAALVLVRLRSRLITPCGLGSKLGPLATRCIRMCCLFELSLAGSASSRAGSVHRRHRRRKRRRIERSGSGANRKQFLNLAT
jgi:hypothetical protein